MEALYKCKANEIDSSFIESIRQLFKEKNIVIKISDEMDETQYLSLYPENEKHILNNIAAEPSAKFTSSEFIEYTQKYKDE